MPDRQGHPGRGSHRPGPPRGNFGLIALWAGFAVQALSALVFIGELWSEVLGLRSFVIGWEWIEIIQIMASVGLLLGTLLSGLYLYRNLRDVQSLRRQVDVASGQFQKHLKEMFLRWDLSPSESEVAVFAMKGFSNAEIAELRGTSAATAKSQMTAVYRKTGHSNRQQLISFLVEELLAGVDTRRHHLAVRKSDIAKSDACTQDDPPARVQGDARGR